MTAAQQDDEERNVKKSFGVAVFVSALIAAGAVAAQGMLVDTAADKVIAKYQAASCDQLKAQKSEPPTEKETVLPPSVGVTVAVKVTCCP